MPDGSERGGRSSEALFTLPNVITFGRLCAVPLAFWLVIDHHPAYAFFLFVGAGISDAVDGWLARRCGSNIVGSVLDPVADKALLVTMYVTLAAVAEIPDWLAILVVFRDAMIVGGFIVFAILGQAVVIRPLYVSKINTALQILLIALTLFLAGFGLSAPVAQLALVWLVGAATLVSGAAYVWVAARGI
jgi:cardiolipin synthase